MTDARTWLDQVDARTNAATDGPWTYGGQGWVFGPSTEHTRDDDLLATVTDDETGVFIAHARTDLPAGTTALRAVLDLHADDGYGDCTGCGVDTYENAISWPCATVTAITTALEDA
ncbi:hypothetical protein [Oerskovia rustica]|uniref:Uncharacterized protein n=1 Tax=Oerskovia rustica TaxID=2762237 RepID=A0ABR8RP83_9CELL|nr:hypothetical protein [Oerskovia rustica]MBD7949608.1 hypothetical protein [Oerskovia rustica]